MAKNEFTWADACAYVESVIDDECAAQGVTRRITDPGILATSVRLLRIGKRRYEERLRQEAQNGAD